VHGVLTCGNIHGTYECLQRHDNVVSPITCVSMNHQNQLEQMTNEAMFATGNWLNLSKLFNLSFHTFIGEKATLLLSSYLT
jgi:hypothetical protein